MIAVITQGAWFVALWLVLAGADPSDLPGMIAAVLPATAASLVLLPPDPSRWPAAAFVRLAPHLVLQSIVAGADVAWRALSPRLPLRPGFVAWPARQLPASMQNAFCTLMSLPPGSLPTEMDGDGAIAVHCLDLDQPVAAQLTAEAARFRLALGSGEADV